MKIKPEIKSFIFSYLITALFAGIGTFASVSDSGRVYEQMIKPDFAPPSWIFSVVWPILYILMAAAYGIYLNKRSSETPLCSFLYISGLILTAVWPHIFFVNEEYKTAFFIIVALIALGVLTFYCFIKESKVSAFLYLPYILWIIFAGVLNYNIALLNP